MTFTFCFLLGELLLKALDVFFPPAVHGKLLSAIRPFQYHQVKRGGHGGPVQLPFSDLVQDKTANVALLHASNVMDSCWVVQRKGGTEIKRLGPGNVPSKEEVALLGQVHIQRGLPTLSIRRCQNIYQPPNACPITRPSDRHKWRCLERSWDLQNTEMPHITPLYLPHITQYCQFLGS